MLDIPYPLLTREVAWAIICAHLLNSSIYPSSPGDQRYASTAVAAGIIFA